MTITMPHAVSALQGAIERSGAVNWALVCDAELNENWMPDWHPDGSPKLTSEYQGVTLFLQVLAPPYRIDVRRGSLAENIYEIARFLFEFERCQKASEDLAREAMSVFIFEEYKMPPICWRRALRIRPGTMPTMAHLKEAVRDAKARNVPGVERYYEEAMTEMEEAF